MRFPFLLVLFGSVACAPRHYTVIDPRELPRVLQPLAGASNVLADREEDSSVWIHYRLEEKYPARGIVELIGRRLTESGWQPLQYDLLNPKIPSSHLRGWTSFEDATEKPPAMVDQWIAHWRNARGDVVMYDVRYVSPSQLAPRSIDQPDNAHLRIVGVLIPDRVVRGMLAEIEAKTPSVR
jgi:hypothetical protein